MTLKSLNYASVGMRTFKLCYSTKEQAGGDWTAEKVTIRYGGS